MVKITFCVDNNGEERCYIVAVVFDIHKAANGTARIGLAVDSNGDCIEDGSDG